MKINLDATYDPKADSLYVTVRDTKPAKTMPVNKTTLLDFDKDEQLVGIEILGYGRWEPPKGGSGVKKPRTPSKPPALTAEAEIEEKLQRWQGANKEIPLTLETEP